MVSRNDKKPSTHHRKRKVGAVEALLADPVDLSITKAEKAVIRNSRTNRSSSVISAIIYDKSTVGLHQNLLKTNLLKKPIDSAAGSSHTHGASNLTFTTKLRNVIQFVFEGLRENIARSTTPSADIEKSIREMRALNGNPDNQLSEEIKRHLIELIEETEAFVRGEKTGLTGVPDFQSALHYRHYVRIAWLSHFILNNLPGPALS
jgi:hypothetical protein